MTRYSPAQLAALERLFVSGPDYAERFDARVLHRLEDDGLIEIGRHKGRGAVRLSGEGNYFMGGDE